MLAISFFVLAWLGHAALSVPTAFPRDSPPSDTDLLLSCPGGPGSPNVKRADKCTLVNIVNNTDTPVTTNVGDVQANCQGGTSPVELTVGGSTTSTTDITSSVNLGISFEGISIGGGLTSETSTTTTSSNSTKITIPPGRQSVMTVSVINHNQSGNVQVNYGSKVDGHFIWFTDTVITKLTPTNEVTFDVHETKCGTDPLDLSNVS